MKQAQRNWTWRTLAVCFWFSSVAALLQLFRASSRGSSIFANLQRNWMWVIFVLLYLIYNDWLTSQSTLSTHRCPSCSSSRMSSDSSVAGARLWKQCQRKMHRRAMIQCRHRIDLVHDLMHQDIRAVRHSVRVRRTLARVHSTKLNSNNDNFSCFHE